MTAALTSWATPRLSALLPLDDDSLTQIITYTTTLSKPAAAEHLKNLLGDSPQALEFISAFNSRRGITPEDERQGKTPSEGVLGGTDKARGNQGPSQNQKKKTGKAKQPLHSVGPARRPDGYGDMSGGYHKANVDKDYMPGNSRSNPSSRPTSISSAVQLSPQPEALQLPTTSLKQSALTSTSLPSSTIPSRTASPAPNSSKATSKAPPSASGPLISDHLFTNVRSRTLKLPHPRSQPQSSSASPSRKPHNASATDNTTDEISDLTSAISLLERTTNPSKSTKKVTCPCNATIHPLFTPAPNCLSCGKIICALEGNNLQPCSFCDTPLLTPAQTQAMISALRSERGIEKMAAHNAAAHPRLPAHQTDIDSSLTRAEEHKNRLLAFQRENARRTKVVDEVAEFDAPEVSGWMSPVERAKALKAQQKYAREMEEKNKPEWEKKKTVLSLDVSRGRVKRTYNRVDASSLPQSSGDVSEEDTAPEESVDEAEASWRGGTFARNPLLAGNGNFKLVRPIWKDRSKGKAAEGVEATEGRDERKEKSTWRRVQDDNEAEGEKWILDGGVYGFESESGRAGDEPGRG